VVLVAASGAAFAPSQLVPGFALADAFGGPFGGAAATQSALWTGEGVSLSSWPWNPSGYADRGRTILLAPAARVRSVAAGGDLVFAGTDIGVFGVAHPDGDSVRYWATPGRVAAVAAGGDWVVAADESYGYLIGRADEKPFFAGWPVAGGAHARPAVHGSLALLPANELVGVHLGVTPSVRFRADLGGPIYGVALGDEIAYATVEGVGLVALDLSDPGLPRVVSTLPETPMGALELSGANLWLVGAEVRLIDVSDSRAPRDVFESPGPYARLGGASSVVQWADTLVATRGAVLDFADCARPDEPSWVAQAAATWPVTDVAIATDHALIAKGPTGLDIVRLGRPSSWVSGYGPPGGVLGAAADSYDAYLSSGLGGELLDITQPGDPVPSGLFGPEWPLTAWIAAVTDAVVAGSVVGLRVAERQGRTVTDAGDLDFGDLPDWPVDAVVQGVAAVPSAAYLAAGAAGVSVIDTSDPFRPRVTRHVPADGMVSSVSATGNRLAVGTDDGWALMRLADVHSPELVQRVRTGAGVGAVSLTRSRLTVADETGVREVDLDSPASDARRLQGIGPVRLVEASGDRVLVVTENAILDLVRAEVPEPAVTPSPTPPPTLAALTATAQPTETASPTATEAERVFSVWLPWAYR
jgi:hypothetical protein